MKKMLWHIVPAMDVGGVEIAISRSWKIVNATIDYQVYYVRRHGILQCGQKPIWRLLVDIIFCGVRPDFIITSLWWSHAFGLLGRVYGIPWISFFHSEGFSHIFDRVSSRWAWRKSSYRFVDSSATHKALNSIQYKEAFLIPCVFPSLEPTNIPWSDKEYDFVWIGRSAVTKRIDLFIQFLRYSEKYWEKASVVVIIAGSVPETFTQFLKSTHFKITILQNEENKKVLDTLSRSKFYLLFSDHEGMSMSTIEAVQSGCVPVVRRVGEIATYLDHQSCICVLDDSSDSILQSSREVYRLSNNCDVRTSMLEKAAASVDAINYYVPSMMAAIRSIESAK